MKREIVVAAEAAGWRLDRTIAAATPGLGKRKARALVESGQVFVDGRRVRAASHKVEARARIVVHEGAPAQVNLPAVIYEDRDLIVIDKPAGTVINTTETRAEASIVEQLDAYAVHRLDREVTGVCVLAKNKGVCEVLSRAFRERGVEKRYLAIVEGELPLGPPFEIDQPIGADPRRPRARRVIASGQPSRTRVAGLSAASGISAVRADPLTGRTHQIRVHLAHAGHPILGDTTYGGPAVVRVGREIVRAERVMLHACRLTLPLPGGEVRTFDAPLPEDIARFERLGLALGAVFA